MCFDNFVLCFYNFVLCFYNLVLCFKNIVLCFKNIVLCFRNIVLCFKNCLLRLQIWATVGLQPFDRTIEQTTETITPSSKTITAVVMTTNRITSLRELLHYRECRAGVGNIFYLLLPGPLGRIVTIFKMAA